MNLIVAVDEKWGIGCDNELLASIPGDMQYFKEKTTCLLYTSDAADEL